MIVELTRVTAGETVLVVGRAAHLAPVRSVISGYRLLFYFWVHRKNNFFRTGILPRLMTTSVQKNVKGSLNFS